MKKNIIVLVFMLFSMFSCKTDFNINAPWKDITIVYFILNQNDSAHYAKINKAFLGEENAYVMANEPDSVNYKDVEAWLISYQLDKGDTTWLDSMFLEPTNEVPKDTVRLNGEPAIFSSESNLLYKTNEKLKTDRYYMFKANIPSKHKSVNSTTSLISNFYVIKPGSGEQIKFYSPTYGYRDFLVKWQCDSKAVLYGLTLRFHYREEYSDDTYKDKYIDWVRPNISHADPEGKDIVASTFPGDAFYSFINSMISVGNDPGVVRSSTGIDFIFVSAGEELSTYIEINGPSNSIVQEHPIFTNITNGIGVFSSRYNRTMTNRELDSYSLDRLSSSDITKHLRFKDSNGLVWAK